MPPHDLQGEERDFAARRSARPCASRVDVGRSEGAQALPAPWVDGRRRVVPVPRRWVCARLVRDCSRSSRLWPQRMATAGLLVRRLHRGPRSAGQCVRARRDSESGGPQPRRECRDDVCGRAAGPRATNRLARRIRHPGAIRPMLRRRRSRRGSMRSPRRRNLRRTRASMRSPIACKRTIRACRATKRLFLAGHWAEATADGGARLLSDPRHKLPFPTTYRLDEAIAVWRRIAAPTLWVAAAESTIPKWLDDRAEGEAGADGLDGVRRRMAHLGDARLVVVPDAGHMLHHDQPRTYGGGDRSVPDRTMSSVLAVPDLHAHLEFDMARDHVPARHRGAGSVRRLSVCARRSADRRRSASRPGARCACRCAFTRCCSRRARCSSA